MEHKAVINSPQMEEVVTSKEFKLHVYKTIEKLEKLLDFSLQKRKMVEILGWDPEVINDVEKLYIKFLALIKSLRDFNLDIKIIPNKYIDEFWHAHILDTLKYHEDCKKIFGEYLHHFPYYGMRNEEDLADWLENAQVCQWIWEEVFGEKLYGTLDTNEDGYILEKEFYSKLSKEFKQNKEKWAMGCRRCRTCRPTRCP